MRRKRLSWLSTLLAGVLGLVLTLAGAMVGSSPNHAASAFVQPNHLTPVTHEQLQAIYGKLPLSFEANFGQTDERVKFLSRGRGYTLFLTPTETVMALYKSQGQPSKSAQSPQAKLQQTADTSTTVMRLQLLGSNLNPQVSGLEPLPGNVNYLLGNDPKQWHRNIPTYARVQYHQVYPGVDMVYYGNQGLLEYDFLMAAGTDLNIIKLAFQGVEQLEVNDQQELVLHTGAGELKLHQPLAYQQVNGLRKAIASHYVLKGKNQVGFQVAAYDRSQPLIIDPVLSYSTYLGGSWLDVGRGIAVDRVGNAYVTGSTQQSNNFPTQNPFQTASGGSIDAFVTKLDSTGSALVYSTYLGGSNSDSGNGIAVDRGGNAYVTGSTRSHDFPTQNPFQPALGGNPDTFVTKLDSTGSALVYSTYLGGSNSDSGNGIAVDRGGNAYVTGSTESFDFPTQNPFQPALGGNPDAFVTKLDSTGSALVYSTYLGGSNLDSGNGITVDGGGNAYVTGSTESFDFPTQNPFQPALGGNRNAFGTKLDSTGSALVYSTYLGGSNLDSGSGIAVDRAGNAYVTGSTQSHDFPTQNPFQPALGGYPDAFVTKLDLTGSALVYSTYLGGSNSDSGNGITVDRPGQAYVTGFTYSNDFPTQNAFQSALGGTPDAFVTKLDSTGSALVYSTYLGGSNVASGSYYGNGIAVDRGGNAYVIGQTGSKDFPTQNAFQSALGGIINAFVTKLTP